MLGLVNIDRRSTIMPKSELLVEDFANAIEDRDSIFVESLLANGEVDANARLPRENNPPALVFATLTRNAVIAKLLLDAGARIDDVDDNGDSACHVAARFDHSFAFGMRVLLKHRPNLALRNTNDKTALQIAFQLPSRHNFHEDDLALLLIREGAPLTTSIAPTCASWLRPARLPFTS
jgi:ankyrin repeat protein